MADWTARSKRIITRYKDERPALPDQVIDRKFAILWSNIQTLGPAVYARTPEPVVTRRYKDSDPVGRYASEVLERGISYSMGGRDAYASAVRAQVERTTDADLAEYAEHVKSIRAAQTEPVAQVKAAMKDPKTLDDFEM